MRSFENNLHIISGEEVGKILFGKEKKIIQLIRAVYIDHQNKKSIIPHSVFLRFPSETKNRIIGLPSCIGKTVGIKWISSFPDNLKKGMDRASAAIILNSLDTGRPYVVLEGSIISAKRTAASAALAAVTLSNGRVVKTLSLVGCGLINFEIFKFIISQFRSLERVNLFDTNFKQAELFSRKIKKISDINIKISNTIEECLQSSMLISLATTATTPYITSQAIIPKQSVVLNISLRDISPDIIKNNFNIIDDIEHVNRENTSVHLATMKYGDSDFINGSLGAVLVEKIKIYDNSKRIIFSPFGLGILDMQLARFVYEQADKSKSGTIIKNFIPPLWHERSY